MANKDSIPDLNQNTDPETDEIPSVIGVTLREDEVDRSEIPDELPILTSRGLVVFPGTVVPVTVGRPASIKLLEDSLPKSKLIGVVAQKDSEETAPKPEGIYKVGVAVRVLKFLRQTNDTILVVIQALRRITIREFTATEPWFRAKVEILETQMPKEDDKQWQATIKNLRETALKLIDLSPDVPDQARSLIMNLDNSEQLADFLASNLNVDFVQKQDLLEELDLKKRVRAVQLRLSGQLEIAQIQQKLKQDIATEISSNQRRAYLREQIKAIQRELGEDEPGTDRQIQQLRERLLQSNPPPQIMEQVEKELKRLNFIPPASPEFSMIISYVEIISELPWSMQSEDHLDLDRAQQVLDRDHYDLEKVKRRLIEYLAVRKLNPSGRGPILCFVGPPGVGKTSLGQSIADAIGRQFARLSLGGIRDEAEIRGHRRTYVGSMPGRIIHELRRLKTKNPVIMLDEVDKLGADFRGDPASALLEVLDPRQNFAFVDRYLDVPFDLSQVIFIATANYLDPVPPALRDRMETIEIPGYTEHQKLEIARTYLVRRQLEENGLQPHQCAWSDECLLKIINDYTREAGVRELERQIGSVCRAIAAQVARSNKQKVIITPEMLEEILGPIRYVRETRLNSNIPGVASGLAYTPFGGEVLHIEATKYSGNNNIILTGQIGNVMKESMQAALSLVKSRSKQMEINSNAFKEVDIHVHVPSGAVPKDGPSAGIAMFAALASLFSGISVRSNIAMTGEITLRGLVLPVGGLKEKSLAALRAGIETIILPKLNQKDLPEIPTEAKEKLKFVFVEKVDEVLKFAFDNGFFRHKARSPNKKHTARTRTQHTRKPVEHLEEIYI